MSNSNIFSGYIHTESIRNFAVPKFETPKMSLSKDEAKQDFEVFTAIMLYAYSGRQYWENKINISFKELFEKAEARFFVKNSFGLYELYEFYHKCFNEFIVDNHLKFYTSLSGVLGFSANKYAYFSGITVEESNGKMIVIKSEYAEVKVGDMIESEEKYLFQTLSSSDKKHYLIGIRSWNEESSMTVICNNREVTIPLHKCRASLSKRMRWAHFNHEKIGNIDAIESNVFNNTPSYTYEDAKKLGESLRSSQAIIWNLTKNGGGSSNYADYFIRGLNGYSNFNTHTAILHSNYTENNPEEEAYYKWDYVINEPCDYTKSEYQKTMYVLMDSRTGSSGENAVAYAKSVKNCITIGENTYGCGVFGELKPYQLPYSKMILVVPSKIFLGGFEEGIGYEPDYWVDNEDIQGEVIKWINDKDKYAP